MSPILASSGKTNRYRLNRAGDRRSNSALYHIVIVRLRYDQAARDYAARRTAEGKTKMEIVRCLKRYLVRQLYPSSSKRCKPHGGHQRLDINQ